MSLFHPDSNFHDILSLNCESLWSISLGTKIRIAREVLHWLGVAKHFEIPHGITFHRMLERTAISVSSTDTLLFSFLPPPFFPLLLSHSLSSFSCLHTNTAHKMCSSLTVTYILCPPAGLVPRTQTGTAPRTAGMERARPGIWTGNQTENPPLTPCWERASIAC